MSKRTVWFLVVAVVLLVSSVAFAENPAPSFADESFISSLQEPSTAVAPDAPALTPNTPEPTLKACTYQCNRCGTNKVKLCSLCNGVTSCEPCHSGTTCSI